MEAVLKKPLTDEDLLERAAIDGRVAFAAAVFLGAAGLVALLDRVGVPERFVEVLGSVIACAGLALVGVLLRSMRVSRFYAGGRAIPPAYAGLAMATIAAGLFLPFVPPVEGAISLPGLLVGFAGGMALAALLTGPLLRKTGAFSIPDLIAGRFPNIALRLGVATVVAAIGLLVAFAGYSAAVTSLVAGLGAPRGVAVTAVGIAIVLVGAPGGLGGAVWAAAGAAGMLVAGLGLPLALLAVRGASLPLPLAGDRAEWERALGLMVEWQGATSGVATAAGATAIAAIVLGLGSLAPILGPAITTADYRSARRGGLAAMAWGLVMAILVAATMAAAALAFDRAMTGARPGDIPGFVIAASHEGRARICGANPETPGAAARACATRAGFRDTLRRGDFAASGAFLVQALPDLRGLGRAFSGLAIAGFVAVALALAAAGFHAFATAVGHDAFYRVRDETAMTSRRLAVTRLLLVAGVVAAGIVLDLHAPDPRALVGLAIALGAAAIAPLLLLSLAPRAEGVDATIALLCGLAAAETVIFLGGSAPAIDVFAPAAVIAACVSLVAGLATSLSRRSDPTSRGGAIVQGVLHGESEVLNPDKGA